MATIIESEYSKIPIDFFLKETAMSVNSAVDFSNISQKEEHIHEHYHTKESIENIVIKTSIKEKENLDKALGKILWDLSEEKVITIIRFKGIFYDDSGKKYNIQGLYDLYEINEIPQEKESSTTNLGKPEGEKSKILLIGKNLMVNKDLLEKTLSE